MTCPLTGISSGADQSRRKISILFQSLGNRFAELRTRQVGAARPLKTGLHRVQLYIIKSHLTIPYSIEYAFTLLNPYGEGWRCSYGLVPVGVDMRDILDDENI